MAETVVGRRGHSKTRLDLAVCWNEAKRRIREASGINPDSVGRVADPVARARRLAELAAPAAMRLTLAFGLGASAEALEADRAGARLLLETAHRNLSIVGLRAGEVQEHELSERFQHFMRVFFAPPKKEVDEDE